MKYSLFIITFFLILSSNAQAPQGFNYQATVRDAGGNLILNTSVYFKFNIQQGSQTAVPSYTEVHFVPTDDLGQVNLVIGQGTPSTGVFSELDWSLGSYFLSIELDTGSGYVAMGTTQFLSVPYALYAETSGSGSGTGLPNGVNDGDTLVWDSSSNSWIVDGSEFCQIDLSTTDATNISTTSFTLNGTISTNAQNCEPPNNTEQGFVYSYSVQPTIYNNKVNVDGTEISAVILNALNKTHYYRTFITTASGTFYGNTISFTPTGFDGSLEDIDGNTYNYITYGNQDWTVENVALETYRDGTPIPQITDYNEWINTTIGAWCYINNDSSQGKLYNFWAIYGKHDNDDSTPLKQFAPEGWHVPTLEEVDILKEHLIENGYNYDGSIYDCPCEDYENKIGKSVASSTGWTNTQNTGTVGNDQSSNNYSGFNAKPLGFRYGVNTNIDDGFEDGVRATFWTDNFIIYTVQPWFVYAFKDLYNDGSNDGNEPNYGHSVRFVRD